MEHHCQLTSRAVDTGSKLGAIETGALLEVSPVVDGAIEWHRHRFIISHVANVVEVDTLVTSTDEVTALVLEVHG